MKLRIAIACVFLAGQTIGLGQPGALPLKFTLYVKSFQFPSQAESKEPKEKRRKDNAFRVRRNVAM